MTKYSAVSTPSMGATVLNRSTDARLAIAQAVFAELAPSLRVKRHKPGNTVASWDHAFCLLLLPII